MDSGVTQPHCFFLEYRRDWLSLLAIYLEFFFYLKKKPLFIILFFINPFFIFFKSRDLAAVVIKLSARWTSRLSKVSFLLCIPPTLWWKKKSFNRFHMRVTNRPMKNDAFRLVGGHVSSCVAPYLLSSIGTRSRNEEKFLILFIWVWSSACLPRDDSSRTR